MAIPAYGTAGTEFLHRTIINTLANSETAFRWDDRLNATTGTSTYGVDTNHLVTVLTISFCNTISTATAFDMKVSVAGSTDIYLLMNQGLGGHETFIWSDRILLFAADRLQVVSNSGSNVDCYCTFIDQTF
jgi:hypothetical protein